jgi:hypothetical protein
VRTTSIDLLSLYSCVTDADIQTGPVSSPFLSVLIFNKTVCTHSWALELSTCLPSRCGGYPYRLVYQNLRRNYWPLHSNLSYPLSFSDPSLFVCPLFRARMLIANFLQSSRRTIHPVLLRRAQDPLEHAVVAHQTREYHTAVRFRGDHTYTRWRSDSRRFYGSASRIPVNEKGDDIEFGEQVSRAIASAAITMKFRKEEVSV